MTLDPDSCSSLISSSPPRLPPLTWRGRRMLLIMLRCTEPCLRAREDRREAEEGGRRRVEKVCWRRTCRAEPEREEEEERTWYP
eukprot:602499-Hanusia_phi.AAC.1